MRYGVGSGRTTARRTGPPAARARSRPASRRSAVLRAGGRCGAGRRAGASDRASVPRGRVRPPSAGRRVPGERPGRRPAGLAARRDAPRTPRRARGALGRRPPQLPAAAATRRPPATQAPPSPRRAREERVDLAQRDPAAKLELERGATRRCLAAVTAIEDEGVRDVVAVRNGEEARPEVVVLALAERRVVPQALAIEDCTIDDHRRMKKGDENSAAHRTARAPLGIRCTAPSVPSP